jgi:hypothetical protein
MITIGLIALTVFLFWVWFSQPGGEGAGGDYHGDDEGNKFDPDRWSERGEAAPWQDHIHPWHQDQDR